MIRAGKEQAIRKENGIRAIEGENVLNALS